MGGSCNEDTIANKFADAFETACIPNHTDLPIDSIDSFQTQFREYQKADSNNRADYRITVDDKHSCINTLKRGKASGLPGLDIVSVTNTSWLVIRY